MPRPYAASTSTAAAVQRIYLLLTLTVRSVWPALAVLVLWSFAMWVTVPIRQTYLNGLIPSAQRATVLSFDSLMTSAGGMLTQPALGRIADLRGYAFSFLVTAVLQLAALPFLFLARREHVATDWVEPDEAA